MIEHYDAGGFLVTFPIWIIGKFGKGMKDYAQARHPDGEIAVVVFTDEDQASTFMPRVAPPGAELISIGTPAQLLALLSEFERHGNTHVVIDPNKRSGATSMPIGQFKSYVASWT